MWVHVGVCMYVGEFMGGCMWLRVCVYVGVYMWVCVYVGAPQDGNTFCNVNWLRRYLDPSY